MKKRRRTAASRASRIILGTLCIVALAALGAQLTYLWRNEIAALWPPAKPWLTEACLALDCDIGLPAHIDMLAIVSAELQSVPQQKDTYTFTALLRNRSALVQRYPHIELALTDASDQPVVRRILSPEQYLAPAQRATQGEGIAANAELPVRVMFETPANRATGFRSALFYP